MQQVSITLLPEQLENKEVIERKLSKKLRLRPDKIGPWRIKRQSLDARKKPILYHVLVDVGPELEAPLAKSYPKSRALLNDDSKSAIVVGFGPAGMFAALELLSKGIRPIVLERGKEVRKRRRDLVGIYRDRSVNPESNYCYGEGGAGTFSDGKLYTRSKKRGEIKRILQTFVLHGADEKILIQNRPHIGTNKLPEIVVSIREEIKAQGGEIHFDAKVTDLILEKGEMNGVLCGDKEFRAHGVILATGHSARDIFELLDRRGVQIEAKEFALGVRIEHPQEVIDSIQYKCATRGPYLPAASYNLVRQVRGKGVFSFCMCPGGIIAPAMTQNGEVVVNGWSPSKRNGKFANSGFVVQIEEKDWQNADAAKNLKAMAYQAESEQRAFREGGSDLTAPAQKTIDFVRGRMSNDLPDCSYLVGVKAVDLRAVLPKIVGTRIREALKHFSKSMPGYVSNESLLVGVESRTSSPVRIPRDPKLLSHPQFSNFYPCGEGAGYAGGIMSAALDGIACAERLTESITT